MFNLIVSGGLENDRRGQILASRVFEYTSPELSRLFFPNDALDIRALLVLPTIFMTEGRKDEVAGVGWLTGVQLVGRYFEFQYYLDPDIPRMRNSDIFAAMSDLQVEESEFYRNHWAIKDVDLFRFLFQQRLASLPTPSIFQLSRNPVNSRLISFMMPFGSSFDSVYNDVKTSLEQDGYQCQRADDMWVHPHIITDVIELLCTSAVVICDLSGKNPNVFYETGIAHTLGKEVILITQSHEDVPFDLRPIRYLHYLNNSEGRQQLAVNVLNRVRTIT